MFEIMGKKYMLDKEASKRYGYSKEWFVKMRKKQKGPPFVQRCAHARVLYELEATDKWFEAYLQQKE